MTSSRPGRRARSGRRVAVAALVAALACSVAGARAQSALTSFLMARMDFSASDVRALNRGAVTLYSLDTPVHEELAHVAGVFLDVAPAPFLERFRDIERFEQGPGTPLIGRFSTPPREEDLAALTLPPADIAALRDCRPGDCGVKLSAAAIERFRNEVDWSAPDAPAQADRLMRVLLLDLVRAYQRDGNDALGVYDDGDKPMPVAENFEALLDTSGPLPGLVPGLLDHLRAYPADRPEGATEFFYWTVSNFGLKDTIRVNHVTILPMEGASSPLVYAIAIKQLYASHYLRTTLELRFVLDRPADGGAPAAALVSMTLARSDGMTGFKGLFLRPVIARRSRDGVAGYLAHVKTQVERPETTE